MDILSNIGNTINNDSENEYDSIFSKEEWDRLDNDIENFEASVMEDLTVSHEEFLTSFKLVTDTVSEEGFLDLAYDGLKKIGKYIATMYKKFIQYVKNIWKRLMIYMKRSMTIVDIKKNKIDFGELKMHISDFPPNFKVQWFDFEGGIPIIPSNITVDLLFRMFDILSPESIVYKIINNTQMDNNRERFYTQVQEALNTLISIMSDNRELSGAQQATLNLKTDNLNNFIEMFNKFNTEFQEEVNKACGSVIINLMSTDTEYDNINDINSILTSILFGSSKVNIHGSLTDIYLTSSSGEPIIENIEFFRKSQNDLEYIIKRFDGFLKTSDRTLSSYMKKMIRDANYIEKDLGKLTKSLDKLNGNSAIKAGELKAAISTSIGTISRNFQTILKVSDSLQSGSFIIVKYINRIVKVSSDTYRNLTKLLLEAMKKATI